MPTSKEEFDFLELLIEHGGSLAEDDIPEEMQTFWIDLLAERSLVRRVPFSTQETPDYHHPDGIWYGYIITPAGRAASAEFKQSFYDQRRQESTRVREKEEDRAYKAKEKRKDRHHNYLVALFGSFVSFALGITLEYKCQIITFIVELFVKP